MQLQLLDHFSVEAITNHQAPPAIQGPKDGEVALPAVLKIILKAIFDAYVIACFDDTGLAEARTVTKKPVIGIGQASFHFSSIVSRTFSVLTTLAASVPVIANNIKAQEFASICEGVLCEWRSGS